MADDEHPPKTEEGNAAEGVNLVNPKVHASGGNLKASTSEQVGDAPAAAGNSLDPVTSSGRDPTPAANGERQVMLTEMQDDDGTVGPTVDGAAREKVPTEGGEMTETDYVPGEEAVAATDSAELGAGPSDGPQGAEESEASNRGSARKESIRDRVRRKAREHARDEDEVFADLPALDSLGKVVEPPNASDIHIFTRDDYPASYSSNSPKEEKLNQHTARFLTQYSYLYPDRKPLFLNQPNDCGLSKCVSTFIRPSLLPYIDCYDWQGCARFVADHVHYRPLSKPTELPDGMLSPAALLRYQSANCFEMATLLCSLLSGAGYSAHIVSGYAVRSVCLQDTSRIVCPDMMYMEKTVVEEKIVDDNKYVIKPQRELVSKYEAMMEERVLEAERNTREAALQEEIRHMNQLEKEPPDPLFGMRVHAWVLVLAGDRDITEPFFIESTTGVGKGIRSPDYLGIESLWSDNNYWVNLQYCINGVRDLEYDLYNPAHWEFLLLRQAMRTPHPDEIETDLEEAVLDADRLMEMPFSWVERLRVPKERYDQRFPYSCKVTKYYRSKVEEFSPYSMKDGVVKRLVIYRDFACETIVSVKENFLHRADHLVSRETTQEEGWVAEHFSAGRDDALREHQYAVLGNNPEDRRIMRYYHKARRDCLETRRVQNGGRIEEEFVDRDDKLYKRDTLVGCIQKKFGPQTAIRKPILSITERMRRNPRGDGDDGVSARTFDVQDAKISVVFHASRGRITAERREFSKPHPDDKARLVPILEEAAASGFDTDPEALPPRMLDLYYMMKAQMDDEEHSVAAVREAEDEIIELLNTRTQEEAALDLETALWDSDLAPQIRSDRKDLEAFLAAQSTRLVEKDKDPLGPFLARISIPESEMSVSNRFQLRDECMQSFRQRLVDKANRLQKQFEEQTESLRTRQLWYQQSYVGLTEEEEETYLTFCHDTMFRLHVLELLLERHKQMAPIKHKALELRLRNDPRISGKTIREEDER